MLISKKKIQYFLLISILTIACLKLDSIQYLTSYGQIYREIPILLAGMLVLNSIFRYKSISHVTYYFLGYYALLLLITILNGGKIHTTLVQICPSLCMSMLCEHNMKRKPVEFLQALGFLLSILVILDFITILIKPNGLYTTSLYTQNWILGYKTQRINIAVPAISSLATSSLYKKNRISLFSWLVLAISIVSAALSQATGGLVALSLFAVILILAYGLGNSRLHDKILKVLNAKIIMIATIVVNILISIMQNIAMFEPIIVGILDKTMTLTGRTVIWNKCIEIIRDNPLFGVGFIDSNKFVQITGIAGGTQPHNMILTFLVYSGIAGLSLYAIPLYKSFSGVKKGNLRLSSVFAFCVIINLIIGITSMNNFSTFNIASIIILCYINEFEKQGV